MIVIIEKFIINTVTKSFLGPVIPLFLFLPGMA